VHDVQNSNKEVDMGYLAGKRAYLGGAIQYGDPNDNWREEPKRVLRTNFGIDLFDPFEDPKQQWVPMLQQAQKDKDYETISKIAHQFVGKDLGRVDRSDFVISYLPYKVPTTGTVHEIVNSNNAKKPTLLVTDREDVSYIPLWYFGFTPKEFMFAGWTALFDYLKEVDDGRHKDNKRWHYVYGLI
jgi:hypothetical protein